MVAEREIQTDVNFWQCLGQNRLLDFGVTLLALIYVMQIVMHLPDVALRNDFAHYYLSSRLVLDGQNPYTTPLEPLYATAGFVFHKGIPIGSNPPGLLWLFAPVALLPVHAAFWVWVSVQTGSLGIILLLTRRLLGESITLRGCFFVAAATVCSEAVFWHFHFSQVQLLLAATILAGYMFQCVKRETFACVLVTLAGLVKLYPFALLPWFVWGTDGKPSERIKRGFVAVVVSCVVVVATGPTLWLDFYRYGLGVLMRCAINHQFNFTLPSLIANLGLAAVHSPPPPQVIRALWLAGITAGMGLLGLAYWLCWKGRTDREAQFCLLSVAMLAGGVTSWGHYFVFLIFPVAVLAVRLARRANGPAIIGFALLLLLLNSQQMVSTPFLVRHLYLKILANYLPLYGLLALGWIFARRIDRPTAISLHQ